MQSLSATGREKWYGCRGNESNYISRHLDLGEKRGRKSLRASVFFTTKEKGAHQPNPFSPPKCPQKKKKKGKKKKKFAFAGVLWVTRTKIGWGGKRVRKTRWLEGEEPSRFFSLYPNHRGKGKRRRGENGLWPTTAQNSWRGNREGHVRRKTRKVFCQGSPTFFFRFL